MMIRVCVFLGASTWVLRERYMHDLSGLPIANAKSQRFSYAISQIAPLPLVVALNRNSKSQIAARYTAFWHAIPQIALASFLSVPKSQRFKSQRLQDANATKSQTLAFYKSQRFSATKCMTRSHPMHNVFCHTWEYRCFLNCYPLIQNNFLG